MVRVGHSQQLPDWEEEPQLPPPPPLQGEPTSGPMPTILSTGPA